MKKKKPRKEIRNETNTEPLWTVEDVALYLRQKEETVRMMARGRKIPALKVGKAWRFRSSEIREFLGKTTDQSNDKS
jgi:excisionase family DNA binding protein